MKTLNIIYKILCLVFVFIVSISRSVSQVEGSSSAEFSIFDVTPDLYTYEFSLAVKRNTDSWERFVNGTFQFEIIRLVAGPDGDEEFPIETYDESNIRFEMIGLGSNNDIKIADFTADEDIVSIGAYAVQTQIIKRDNEPTRLSIVYQGPAEYEENQFIPINSPDIDTAVVLGRFRITNLTDGFPRMTLSWKRDKDQYGRLKYLASAYKLANDLTVQGVENYYIQDDNIDFGKPPFGVITSYKNDTTQIGTYLSSFTARYIGNQVVDIRWRTRSEFRASGFRLYRGYKYPFQDADDIDFDEEPIYTFTKPLTEPITRKVPFDYAATDTTIPPERRGWEVCYRIEWFYLQSEEDGVWKERFDDAELGLACAGVPNSVISYAHAYPNPFQTQSSVEYTVDDDVILTAVLYDLSGKEVEVLMNNQPVKKGTYYLELEFSKTATNGMFDLIFYATPLNDTSVEYSNAVLKLQKIR